MFLGPICGPNTLRNAPESENMDFEILALNDCQKYDSARALPGYG